MVTMFDGALNTMFALEDHFKTQPAYPANPPL